MAMAQMLYPKYQLNRRLGRPQNWSGCSREYKNLFILNHDSLVIQPTARSVISLSHPSSLSHVIQYRSQPFLPSEQLLSSQDISHFLMNVNIHFVFTKTWSWSLTLARIIHPTSNLM